MKRVARRHVALLRAHLRHRYLRAAVLSVLAPSRRRPGGAWLLVAAAFGLAARRRFDDGTRADVIRWVAGARIERGVAGPGACLLALPSEKLILSALAGTRAEGLTPWQRAQNMILLDRLVTDARLSRTGLDAFIAEACTAAERVPRP